MKNFIFCISFITLIIYTQDISMKMRIFKQNKLWRDNLPKKMAIHGSVVHITRLNDAEYDFQLRIKLQEEAEEVKSAQSTQDLIEEIADVYEVIDALIALHKIDKQAIIDAQTKKRLDRGGFEGRTFVTTAEHPEGSFGVHYCLADPEKYPEIR